MNRRPILVTGMPRSGTTWLARQLAGAPGTAMTGREPMNSHNRQYALGGTVEGWTRLDDLTPRQARLIATTYRGLNPWVYGRYGHRQWLAPLPGVRCVVKDPFALLSVPAIVARTGAEVVVVYRHPGAVLASWRRMGWTAKAHEVARVEGITGQRSSDAPDDEVGLLGRMWRALHRVVLRDAAQGVPLHVVSHEELGMGGPRALQDLFAAVGLTWAERKERLRAGDVVDDRLHNLDRDPREVARAWTTKIGVQDLERLEEMAGPTLTELARLRRPVPGGDAAEAVS
ncbi:MAG TPA: sulfotransferase [Jiangellaceae bacterium]|nr:sulfotransferase [Jiangellaceae bacterium]